MADIGVLRMVVDRKIKTILRSLPSSELYMECLSSTSEFSEEVKEEIGTSVGIPVAKFQAVIDRFIASQMDANVLREIYVELLSY